MQGKQKILQIALAPGINRLNAYAQPMEDVVPHFLKLEGSFPTEHFKFPKCGSIYKGEMRCKIKGILKKKAPLKSLGSNTEID